MSRAGIDHLSHADTMATLNRFSADMIVDALRRCMRNKAYVVYVSGGGMHNPCSCNTCRNNCLVLFSGIRVNFISIPMQKEAVLFAVLANETVCGGQTQMGSCKTEFPHVSMGEDQLSVLV